MVCPADRPAEDHRSKEQAVSITYSLLKIIELEFWGPYVYFSIEPNQPRQAKKILYLTLFADHSVSPTNERTVGRDVTISSGWWEKWGIIWIQLEGEAGAVSLTFLTLLLFSVSEGDSCCTGDTVPRKPCGQQKADVKKCPSTLLLVFGITISLSCHSSVRRTPLRLIRTTSRKKKKWGDIL